MRSELSRILVFGAGAIGSVLGGLLASGGHEVVLIGRKPHLDAIRERGLKIDGIWGTHHVRERLHCATRLLDVLDRAFDCALVTVKSYDTEAAARSMAEAGVAARAVVSCQNGYGNVETLAQYLPPDRVLGARVITGAEVVAPGHVRVTVSADAIRIGPPDGDEALMPLASAVASLLRESGIPAEPTQHYREFLWDKILYNCALNPLGALLSATYGELAEHPEVREVMNAIIHEVFTVALACGIPLFYPGPEDYLAHFYGELIPPTASHYPSMLRDLTNRGRTEIDSLNGAIVRLGAQAGVETPANRMVTAMIHLREETRRKELMQAGSLTEA